MLALWLTVGALLVWSLARSLAVDRALVDLAACLLSLRARVDAIEERELAAGDEPERDLADTNVRRALRAIRDTTDDARRGAFGAPDSP